MTGGCRCAAASDRGGNDEVDIVPPALARWLAPEEQQLLRGTELLLVHAHCAAVAVVFPFAQRIASDRWHWPVAHDAARRLTPPAAGHGAGQLASVRDAGLE